MVKSLLSILDKSNHSVNKAATPVTVSPGAATAASTVETPPTKMSRRSAAANKGTAPPNTAQVMKLAPLFTIQECQRRVKGGQKRVSVRCTPFQKLKKLSLKIFVLIKKATALDLSVI